MAADASRRVPRACAERSPPGHTQKVVWRSCDPPDARHAHSEDLFAQSQSVGSGTMRRADPSLHVRVSSEAFVFSVLQPSATPTHSHTENWQMNGRAQVSRRLLEKLDGKSVSGDAVSRRDTTRERRRAPRSSDGRMMPDCGADAFVSSAGHGRSHKERLRNPSPRVQT